METEPVFFRAIEHQLELNNVRDAQDQVYTHQLLRGLALSRVDTDSRFRLMMSNSVLADLGRLGGYVDHGAIAALAVALEVNIIVYGAPGGGEVSISSGGTLGSLTDGRPTLRVVYNGHNHYNSVVAASGTRRRARNVLSSQQRSAKRARHEKLPILPVAVKIFEENYRNMRDYECETLRKMEPNNNVPSVVKKVDVHDKPALIVCPAGDKMLPLQHVVRSNSTDFVALLHVLKHAHSLEICHRDVKPYNIFKDQNGRIILSDWSSAATTGKEVPWAGTSWFYEEHPAVHSPRPEDDLVALVRSVYLMHT